MAKEPSAQALGRAKTAQKAQGLAREKLRLKNKKRYDDLKAKGDKRFKELKSK